ncbi:MAG: NACHT domain-containing protein, partial [Candidatus Hodarchaeota archaeon]
KQAERIVMRIRREDALPEEAIKEMLRRMQEVHGVELNPLLITVFVASSDYSRRDIPANITELFKKYTEMMLGRWDASKGLAQQYHGPLKDFLLCQLGFEMHKRKMTSISVEKARRILETELSERGIEGTDIDTLVEEMIDRSGLFRVVDGCLEFRHLLLQEFFAGRGIRSVEFLQSVVADEWWRRAFVFHFGENPGDHISLQTIIDTFSPETDRETFHAAITLGLTLQACYLVKVNPKSVIFWWVLINIVKAKLHFLPKKEMDRFPVTRFLSYYLFGREAVACDIVKTKGQEFLEKHKASDASDGEKEVFQFWTIAGMIECGYLEKAEKMIRGFHPRERRLLLALYLGCIFIENLRVSTKEEKKIAKKICNYISPQIRDLRSKFIDEIRTELIEVRKGKIEPLEPPKSDSSGE